MIIFDSCCHLFVRVIIGYLLINVLTYIGLEPVMFIKAKIQIQIQSADFRVSDIRDSRDIGQKHQTSKIPQSL